MDEIAEQERKEFQGAAGSSGRRKGLGLGRVKVTGVGGKKLTGAAVIVVGIVVAVIGVVVVPPAIVGALKNLLVDTLGFRDTIAILEEQAEYGVSEKMALGEMPAGLAEDFLAQGIEVGQVTLAGEFVRTNSYIADIDGAVAADGEYRSNGTGELVIRFNGEIITADDFVAKVESDPVLYAAYSEGLDIGTRYYYSDAVRTQYKNMGLSQGSFNNWQSSGDAAEGQEQFDKALAGALNKESNRSISGQYLNWYRECETSEEGVTTCWWESEPVSWECSGGGSSWVCDGYNITGNSNEVARRLVEYVAGHCRDDVDGLTAEENAAQILNTLLSADEPYRAASDFMAVMEALEQAQVEGNGPVNEMMNLLSMSTEVSYTDVNTGNTVTEYSSILDDYNLKVALGGGVFSKEEANNVARDRILIATNVTDRDSITSMPLSTNGKSKSGNGLVMDNTIYACSGDSSYCENNRSANLTNVASVISAMQIGMVEKNSESFSGMVGANRILEGGSFISNTINQRVLGALPSDESQVLAYQQEVNTILARQAEAERATKSPFDISSPYTFMGSLVRKMAVATLTNYGAGGSVASSVMGTLAGVASSSVKSLLGMATADGAGETFVTTFGDCLVVPAAGATCDLYHTAKTTIYTGYKSYRESDWARVIDEEEMEKMVDDGMGREATVGVKGVEVCQKNKEEDEGEDKDNDNGGSGILDTVKGLWGKVVSLAKKIVNVVTGATELREECEGVDTDVAIGADTVLHGGRVDGDLAKASGYALYSAVMSLLEDDSGIQAARK